MRHHRRGYHRGAFIGIVTALVLLTGCAGQRISDADSPSALPQARELAGTWHGSYWEIIPLGNSYDDIGDCTLRINEDATYTVACQRPMIGANNIMRPSHWSGRVVTKGNHVILDNGGGPWPSIVLRPSRNGTLYGTTQDPQVGTTVEMSFTHEPSATAGGAGATVGGTGN